MSDSKWYGKIGYDNEGVVFFEECESKEQAELFVKGFQHAQTFTKEDEQGDPLEDYWTHVDQIKPEDES